MFNTQIEKKEKENTHICLCSWQGCLQKRTISFISLLVVRPTCILCFLSSLLIRRWLYLQLSMLTRKVCIFVCECFSCERGNWKPSVRLNDHMPISHVDGWYQARVVAVRLKHITTKCIPSHIIGHWNMLTENANRVLVFVSVNLQMCLC